MQHRYVMTEFAAPTNTGDDSTITTTSNVAYKMVALRGKGGEERSGGGGHEEGSGVEVKERGGRAGDDRGGEWGGVPGSYHHYELINLPLEEPLSTEHLKDLQYAVPARPPRRSENGDGTREGEGNGSECIPGE